MEWFVRAFVKASLAWLAAGVTLGVAMAVQPAWIVYRPAHMHMNLLGFVAMMIYGVAYHVMPRFTGFPLHSRRLAGAHWWMANLGLLTMVVGFASRLNHPGAATILLGTGAVLAASGAYTFVYVLWRTLDGSAPLRQAAARARSSAGTPLPVSTGNTQAR